MPSSPEPVLFRGRVPAVVLGLLVTVLAFFTYVVGYWNPPAMFWDENYHVSSAQKYLNGVFFMEPHPPLGKLFIALGEGFLAPETNGSSDQFLDTDHAGSAPEGFSMAGYRLFPTLFGWLIAPMLYAIFLLITKSEQLAALLTTPYIFDNALIVHSRSAMLEPTLIFFSMAMILLFLLLIRWRTDRRWVRIGSLLLGACFAAVLTTKATGLIMVLLYPALGWVLLRDPGDRGRFRDAVALNALGFLVVFVGVWQAHFTLASTPRPTLPEGGYYRASAEYRQILGEGTTGSIVHFGVMLGDSLAFFRHYQLGVPTLDLCKNDENGSPWYVWPLGARSINYRWSTQGGGNSAPYRYLYLQANPIGWLLGLLGVLLGAGLLLGSRIRPSRWPIRHRHLLTVFLGLYLSYMVAISQLDRVMYLYHYFLPLLFGYLLFGIVACEIRQVGNWKLDERRRSIALMICAAAVFASFQFYRPLTYFEPITDKAFAKRSVLGLWDLRCARCERTGPWVPTTCA